MTGRSGPCHQVTPLTRVLGTSLTKVEDDAGLGKRAAGNGEPVGNGVVGHRGNGAGDLAERSRPEGRDGQVLGASVHQAHHRAGSAALTVKSWLRRNDTGAGSTVTVERLWAGDAEEPEDLLHLGALVVAGGDDPVPWQGDLVRTCGPT